MTILKTYTEGLVTFHSADVDHYTAEKGQPTTSMPVFYNPRMRLNRDLSVIFTSAYLKTHQVDLICEPLAGSGIRTLRYLKECPGEFEAVMFDANPLAIEIAKKNVQMNELEDRVRIIRGDARQLLLDESREKRFDLVDVDPFGTPAPFLNAAVQAMQPHQGLLALTATDMPALCGVYPHVAQRKYGGRSIRAPFAHEIAVRLLIGLAFTVAGMNDCSIEPLVSLSTDHYVRVWLDLRPSRSTANAQSDMMGFIRYCPSCMNTDMVALSKIGEVQPLKHIGNCSGKVKMAGPLWIGPLFNSTTLSSAREIEAKGEQFSKRAGKILELMRKEQELTEFTYVDLHMLCDAYGLSPPRRQDIMDKLEETGHRVTRTHFRPTAIRTDAEVEDVLNAIKAVLGDDQ
ncbi:MAG: tRNA (guanine(10)-N(2))-dimethyltransferase [Candidatus Thorarchaeota archaeon]|nr:tRNA (guanine(10)-N(2))-dimethyltransferase [Candidatus Thorarchaeota archaeon]